MTLGHTIGDRLLKPAADRLSGALFGDQMLSRIGEDEFIVLLDRPPACSLEPESGDSARLADRLLGALAEPFDVDGHRLLLSASIRRQPLSRTW